MSYNLISQDYLIHHGVKGMKWGVRRYQNYDGTRIGAKVKTSISNTKRSITEATENRNKNLTPEEIAIREHRKEVAKKVAIGVGIGLAIGLIAVGAKPGVNKANMEYKRLTNRKANKLATMPISELNNKDTILTAGETTLQRISKDSLESEAAKDVIYATYDENDKAAYQAWFTGSFDNFKNPNPQQIFERKLTKDLVGPSERKRVMYFMQEINADEDFRNAFLEDLHTIGKKKHLKFANIDKIDTSHSRQYYGDFWRMLGDSNSKSRQIYIDKKIKPGYDFINDDNDAGYHANYPVIFLNSQNDTVITGVREKTIQDEINGLIKFDSSAIHGEVL